MNALPPNALAMYELTVFCMISYVAGFSNVLIDLMSVDDPRYFCTSEGKHVPLVLNGQ